MYNYNGGNMHNKINKLIFILIAILIIGLVIIIIYNDNYGLKEYSKVLNYMDSYISIKIYEENKAKSLQALEDIDKIYKKYSKLTDRNNEYDGINNLYYIYYNELNDDTLVLDSELYNMIKFGKEWYLKSDGLIDISKGNINDIWKMYRDSQTGYPNTEELEKANTDSINDIILLEDNKIKNNHPNIYLDDYKMGYVTNIVKDYLKAKQIKRYIINAGGIVIVGDYYEKNQKYGIGLENPDNKGDIYKVIKGNNISVSTTGYYQNYYEYEDVRYNHIINPKTLYPADKLKSVSVICSDSSVASMLSTTLFQMEIDKGKELVKNNSCEAIWYTYDDEIIEFKGK